MFLNISNATIIRRLWLTVFLMVACIGCALSKDAQSEECQRQIAKPHAYLPQFEHADGSTPAQSGNVRLLNFWASWCEPCRAEMPALERLSQRYENQGLQVVAINYRETEAEVQRYVDASGLRLPVQRDADGAMAQSLGVHIFPTTIAIDRHGRIRFFVIGACDWSGSTAAGWINALLSQ